MVTCLLFIYIGKKVRMVFGARAFFSIRFNILFPLPSWRDDKYTCPNFSSSFSIFVYSILIHHSLCYFFFQQKTVFIFTLIFFLYSLLTFCRSEFIALHQIQKKGKKKLLMCLMCFAVRKENYVHHRLNVPLNQSGFCVCVFMRASAMCVKKHTHIKSFVGWWAHFNARMLLIRLCFMSTMTHFSLLLSYQICNFFFALHSLLVSWHDEKRL